jgi:hypothetical protein
VSSHETHGGKGTTKYQNLHQWHEANQLKKVVERHSGKRKGRMKLSLSSKLVEKLVWVPILWLCKIFIPNYSFMEGRMKLGLSSKLVEKLVWVPILLVM